MIQDGDFVILRKDKYMKVAQIKKNGRPFVMDKMRFTLDGIIGNPYGSQFDYDKKNRSLFLVEKEPEIELEADSEPTSMDGSHGSDNRNLVSLNEKNQALGKDEIHALRKEGKTGQEVVSELIKNSTTFNQKTKFSQNKWIKKKKKRHLTVMTILRPTPRLVCEMYTGKDPFLSYMRFDTLSQILSMCNIQSQSKVLLVENCHGLIAASLLYRITDDGKVLQLFTQPNPMKGRGALEDMGYSKEMLKNRLKLYPLNLLHIVEGFQARSSKVTVLKSMGSSEMAVDESAQINENVTFLEERNADEPPSKKSKLTSDEPKSTRDFNQSPESSSNLNESTHDLKQPTESSPGLSKSTHDLKQPTESSTGLSKSTHDLKQTTESLPGLSKSTHDLKQPTENSSDLTKSTHDPLEGKNTTEPMVPVHIKERRASKLYLEQTSFDSLIIAVKTNPAPLLSTLIDKLKLCGQFAVFSNHTEPLVDCFTRMKLRGGVINMRLSESWLREIQVLPERTHPNVNMSGSGGYILTGTVANKVADTQ